MRNNLYKKLLMVIFGSVLFVHSNKTQAQSKPIYFSYYKTHCYGNCVSVAFELINNKLYYKKVSNSKKDTNFIYSIKLKSKHEIDRQILKIIKKYKKSFDERNIIDASEILYIFKVNNKSYYYISNEFPAEFIEIDNLIEQILLDSNVKVADKNMNLKIMKYYDEKFRSSKIRIEKPQYQFEK